VKEGISVWRVGVKEGISVWRVGVKEGISREASFGMTLEGGLLNARTVNQSVEKHVFNNWTG
jgi:hypothetical protein